jgi:hypothetical protein
MLRIVHFVKNYSFNFLYKWLDEAKVFIEQDDLTSLSFFNYKFYYSDDPNGGQSSKN